MASINVNDLKLENIYKVFCESYATNGLLHPDIALARYKVLLQKVWDENLGKSGRVSFDCSVHKLIAMGPVPGGNRRNHRVTLTRANPIRVRAS
jgi:hypothetical protein